MDILRTAFDIVSLGIYFLLISFLLSIAVLFICYWTKKLKKVFFDSEDTVIKHRYYLLIFVCLILVLTHYGTKNYFGSNTIGSVFARDHFTAQYYVNIFPADSKSKNYRLKADVEYFTDDDGPKVYIHKVYWPNGGYTTFSKSIDKDECIKLNHIGEIHDDKGELWYIELTKHKIK